MSVIRHKTFKINLGGGEVAILLLKTGFIGTFLSYKNKLSQFGVERNLMLTIYCQMVPIFYLHFYSFYKT